MKSIYLSPMIALMALLATLPSATAQYQPGSSGDPNSQANILPADQAQQIKQNFDMRFEQIRAQIRTNTATGKLSQANSANLTAQLNQQAAELENYAVSGGGFTQEESQSMVTKLSNFAHVVTDAINSNTTVQIGGGYGRRDDRNGNDPNVAAAAAIDARIASLQTQVTTASNTRQLKEWQIQKIHDSLDDAIALKNQHSPGGINSSEAGQINTALDDVNSQMQHYIASNANRNDYNQPDLATAINSRIATLQTQITTASNARQLRGWQLDKLGDSLDDAIALKNQHAQGGINNSEAGQINSALDDVNSQLRQYITSNANRNGSNQQDLAAAAAINSRIATLEAQITNASNARKLRGWQADKLGDSLDNAIALKNQYAPHGIDSNEAVKINSALDEVNAQMQHYVVTNATRNGSNQQSLVAAAAINSRIASLGTQITNASNARKLRGWQLQKVNDSLDDAIALKTQYVLHGIDSNEAVKINSALDDVNSQMQRYISGNANRQSSHRYGN